MASFTYKPKATQEDLKELENQISSLNDSLANRLSGLRFYNIAKSASAALTLTYASTDNSSIRGLIFAIAANSTGCGTKAFALSMTSAACNDLVAASAITQDTSTAGKIVLTSTRAETYIVIVEDGYITVS